MYKRPDLYPNGTPIPKSLPDSYQPAALGNAPEGQSCFTCSQFTFATRKCSKWDAPVKPRWWCMAWEQPLKKNRRSSMCNDSAVLKRIATTTIEEHFDSLSVNLIKKAASKNEEDVIQLNVPLMIRLLEYAREDSKEDADLHMITERLIQLSEEGEVLEMEDYYEIVPPKEED